VIELILQRGRDRSVRRRHPWLLSGAVAAVRPAPGAAAEPGPGDWTRVISAEGEILGYGHYSPSSSIRVRFLHFGKEDPGDEQLLAERIAAAVARRTGDPLIRETDALRLVNSEGDGLPGLVADRYADTVVVKLSSAGMWARRELVAEALRGATGAARGFERADTTAARREGCAARSGALWGDAPGAAVAIRERDRCFRVDVAAGQKTGFYLDQRDARDLAALLAPGRRVLDLFCYTGGFAVAAARGGARALTLVDSSASALASARLHLEENAPGLAAELRQGDAFQWLRGESRRYDLIVLDPPPLARRRSDVPRATRATKDATLHALRCAAPGALLLVFCCSHHLGPELFRKIVFGASLDAGRPLQVLRELGAPADHPVSLDHPEGTYLKGLLLRAS
jgi:23S rRNA (cytosine1962-C5)-methyltransferase